MKFLIDFFLLNFPVLFWVGRGEIIIVYELVLCLAGLARHLLNSLRALIRSERKCPYFSEGVAVRSVVDNVHKQRELFNVFAR